MILSGDDRPTERPTSQLFQFAKQVTDMLKSGNYHIDRLSAQFLEDLLETTGAQEDRQQIEV